MIKNHNKFIVIDQLTNGILCESITPTVAHSVSLGVINTTVKILANSLPWLSSDYEYNFNDMKSHYQLFIKKMTIVPLLQELVNEQYLEFRNLALIRNIAHMRWEVKCKQFLQDKNHDYHNIGILNSFLCNQLDKCDPKNNYYTDAIHEWATIMDVDAFVAYQELKIKTESIGTQYLRNHAIYQKYVRLINKCTEKTEIDRVIQDGQDYLVSGRSLI